MVWRQHAWTVEDQFTVNTMNDCQVNVNIALTRWHFSGILFVIVFEKCWCCVWTRNYLLHWFLRLIYLELSNCRQRFLRPEKKIIYEVLFWFFLHPSSIFRLKQQFWWVVLFLSWDQIFHLSKLHTRSKYSWLCSKTCQNFPHNA